MQEFFLEFVLRMFVISIILGIYLCAIKREKKLCAKDIYFTLVVLVILCLFPINKLFRFSGNNIYLIFSPEQIYFLKTIFTCIYVVVDSLNLISSLMIIWICGLIVLVSKEIFRYYQLKKYINRWEVIVESLFLEKCIKKYLTEFRIDKKIEVKVCDGIESPFVMGVRKVLLIIPKNLVDTDILPYMLRHEIIHIKRHDNLIKIIMRMVRILNWYNCIFRRIEEYVTLYCEISCDQEAVKNMNHEYRQQYGKTLIKAVELQCYSKEVLVNDFISDSTKISKRIDGVIGVKNRKNKGIAFVLLFLFFLVYFIIIQITDSNSKVMEAYNSINDMSILNNESLLEFSDAIRDLTFQEYEKYGFTYNHINEQMYFENHRVSEFVDDSHKTYYCSDQGDMNVEIKRNLNDEIIEINILHNNGVVKRITDLG